MRWWVESSCSAENKEDGRAANQACLESEQPLHVRSAGDDDSACTPQRSSVRGRAAPRSTALTTVHRASLDKVLPLACLIIGVS